MDLTVRPFAGETEADNIPAQKAYESIGFQTADKLYRYAKI